MGTSWSGGASLPGAVTKEPSRRKKRLLAVQETLAHSEILQGQSQPWQKKTTQAIPQMSPPPRSITLAFNFWISPDLWRHWSSLYFFFFFGQALWTNVPLWPLLPRFKNDLICGVPFLRVNIMLPLSQTDTLIGHSELRRNFIANPHHGASWEFYKNLHIHEA